MLLSIVLIALFSVSGTPVPQTLELAKTSPRECGPFKFTIENPPGFSVSYIQLFRPNSNPSVTYNNPSFPFVINGTNGLVDAGNYAVYIHFSGTASGTIKTVDDLDGGEVQCYEFSSDGTQPLPPTFFATCTEYVITISNTNICE